MLGKRKYMGIAIEQSLEVSGGTLGPHAWARFEDLFIGVTVAEEKIRACLAQFPRSTPPVCEEFIRIELPRPYPPVHTLREIRVYFVGARFKGQFVPEPFRMFSSQEPAGEAVIPLVHQGGGLWEVPPQD